MAADAAAPSTSSSDVSLYKVPAHKHAVELPSLQTQTTALPSTTNPASAVSPSTVAGVGAGAPEAGPPPLLTFTSCATEQAVQDAELSSLLTSSSNGTADGPIITLVSPRVIALPHLYLNHAPGLQKVCFFNPSAHSSVRLHLSSDLGDAVSFMRSLPPAPGEGARPALDSVSWATNSLNWAHHDGLSPHKLALLREISGSLSDIPPDGVVLEAQQKEEFFVLFRPKRVLSQRERNQRSGRGRPCRPFGTSPETGTLLLGSTCSTPDDNASFLSPLHGLDPASPELKSLGSRISPWGGASPSFLAATPPVLGPNLTLVPEDKGSGAASTQHVHHEVYVRGLVTVKAILLPSATEEGASQSQSFTLPLRASFVKPQLRLAPSPTPARPGPESGFDGARTDIDAFPASTSTVSESEPVAAMTGPASARTSSSSASHGSSSLTLDLGACLAGDKVEAPLLVQNVSQIACCIQAKLQPGEGNATALPNPLQLVDGDSRLPPDPSFPDSILRMVDDNDGDSSSSPEHPARAFHPIWIAPFTSRQVIVRLSPLLAHAQAGSNFRRTITITNLHDTLNTLHLHVRACVLAPPSTEDPLAVLPASGLAPMVPQPTLASLPLAPIMTPTNTSSSTLSSASAHVPRLNAVPTSTVLDMGDVVGGRWARQLLLLVNTSSMATLDVDLSATHGYDVTFERARLAPSESLSPSDGHMSSHSCRSTSVASSYADWAGEPFGRTSASNNASTAVSAAQSPPAVRTSSRSLSETSSAVEADPEETPGVQALRTPVPRGGDQLSLSTGEPQGGAFENPPPLSLDPITSPRDLAMSPAATGTRSLSPGSHQDDQDADSNASEAGSVLHSVSSNQSEVERPSSPLSAHTHGPSTSDPLTSVHRRPVPYRPLHPALSQYLNKSSLGGSKTDDGSVWSETTSNSLDSRRSTQPPPTTVSALSSQPRFGTTIPASTSAGIPSLRGAVGPPASAMLGSASPAEPRPSLDGDVLTETFAPASDGRRTSRISLAPLSKTRILIAYRPVRGPPDPSFAAGKLKNVNFDVFVDTSSVHGGATVRRAVHVMARTCTSFITISPKVLDFGETSVGARKTGTLYVRNESQLTARVDVRFVSKVLSMYRAEVPIAPGQTVGLKLDFFPRRINSQYRKQLTVTNLFNRENDQIFEVRSRNLDTQRISLHSLFYRILTPSGVNFIDFGDVYINSPAVRSFTIENTSPAPLTLEIAPAQSEDLGLFVRSDPGTTLSNKDLSKKLRPAPVHKSALGEHDHKSALSSDKKHSSRSLDHTPSSTPPGRRREASSSSGAGDKAFADAGLKEQFLETLSTDSPTSIRKENASWRLAQKHAHTKRRLRKDTSPSPVPNGKGRDPSLSAMDKSSKESVPTSPPSGNGLGAAGSTLAKARSHTHLVNPSARGGKGNRAVTVRYHSAAAFKDKLALRNLEPLDLASGPPVSPHRVSPKSKMIQRLDQMAAPVASTPALQNASGEPRRNPSPAPAPMARPGVNFDHLRTPTNTVPVSGRTRTPSPSEGDNAFKAITPSFSPASASGPSFAVTPVPASTGDNEAKESRKRRAPALTGQQARAPKLADFTDVSKLTVEEALSALEAQGSKLHTIYLGSPDRQERAVRTEINLQRRLGRVLASSELTRLDTLTLQPGEQVKVWCVYRPNGSTRPHIQGNARKQDSRIYLRLLNFDASLLSSSGSPDLAPLVNLDPEELPVRELMLRAVTCRSLMELGQPHINFGTLDPGEVKVRKIIVHNRAEWPLRYCIRKSGSIASGDIRIAHGGRYGIVPGYGHCAVEFGFSPTMSGSVNERLVLENVADRDNDQTVVVKAHIRRVPNFSVAPAVLPLGAVTGSKLSQPTFFHVNNISSKPRSFTVDLDRATLQAHRCVAEVGLALAPSDQVQQHSVRTQAQEEEVEHAAQKLKIALRKGQADKISKYKEKLKQLGAGLDVAGVTTDEGPQNGKVVVTEGAGSGTEATSDAAAGAAASTRTGGGESASGGTSGGGAATGVALSSAPSQGGGVQLKRSSSSAVTLSLEAGRTARIAIWVRVRRTHTALGQAEAEAAAQGQSDRGSGKHMDAQGEDMTLLARIHETKNADVTKTVQVRLHAVLDAPVAFASGPAPFEETPLSSASSSSWGIASVPSNPETPNSCSRPPSRGALPNSLQASRTDLPAAPGSYPLTPSVEETNKQLAESTPLSDGIPEEDAMPPQAAIFTSHAL